MLRWLSCHGLFLVADEKGEKEEEELPEQPIPEEEPAEEPLPPQEVVPEKPPEEQCQTQETELKKKDESREQCPSQEKKRNSEMYSPRKENQERGSRKPMDNKHQEDESKSR